MEKDASAISEDVQSSLRDLSKDLCFLGLQPLASTDNSKPVEVCEALLNAAWHLVHTIHCLSNTERDMFLDEKELCSREEKLSLETQLHLMKQEKEKSDRNLYQEVEVSRRLQEQIKLNTKQTKKLDHQVSCLLKKLSVQEDIHKREIAKHEVEKENLRILLKCHKVSNFHPSPEENLARNLDSLSIFDRAAASEADALRECSINRLMTSNQELIGENLMLRDSLRNVHADLALLLGASNSLKLFLDNTRAAEDVEEDPLPENAFRLPLSHGMNVLAKLRESQISSLNEALISFRSFVFSHS